MSSSTLSASVNELTSALLNGLTDFPLRTGYLRARLAEAEERAGTGESRGGFAERLSAVVASLPAREGTTDAVPPPARRVPPTLPPRVTEALKALGEEEAVGGVIVFGSHGSRGVVPFSDVDVAVFLEAGALGRARALKRAVMRAVVSLLDHDPTQHHGLVFVLAETLGAYPAHYLPPEELSAGALLHGAFPRALAPVYDAAAAEAKFRAFAVRLRRAPTPRSAHALKSLVSVASLLPVLYLQRRGERVTKGESFGRLAALRPELADAVETISAARLAFPRLRSGALRALTRLGLNPWFAQACLKRGRRPPFPPEAVTRAARRLAEALLG